MQPVQSILKFTFDPDGTPLVLLDHGWWIDGPIKFPQKNGRTVDETPDSAYPLILATLNSSWTMKFSVIDDTAASLQAGMSAVLNSLITIPALGVKPLKIEVQGISGHHWKAASCHVSENEPWQEPAAKVRTIKSYTLTCAGMSYT